MESTIIVGLIFAGILFIAARKAISDAKNKKCAGCSGGCSSKNKCS